MGIQIERNLEPLSAAIWICIWILSDLAYPLWLFVIVFSPCKWSLISLFMLILYLSWIFIIDKDVIHQGGRRYRFMQKLPIWNWLNRYFPVKIVKSSECTLDPKKNYLFCSHPHGLFCLGVHVGFASDGNSEKGELFGGFKFSFLTANVVYMLPLLREVYLGMGCCSVSRQSMNHILSQEGGGNIAVFVPGGIPEALDFCPGKYILRLRKRKGFIKVALQNGATLVPVFSFGENITFSQVSNQKGSGLRMVQDWIQKTFNIPAPLWYGQGLFQNTFGFLPKRVPITVVVGAPIPVERIDSPSPEEIDELHERYLESLTKLFYEYREKYSPDRNDVLIIK